MPSKPSPTRVIPKYALLENERRFQVDAARVPDLAGLPYRRLVDRYVEGTRLRLRSVTHSDTGEIEFKFCKKYPSNDPVSGAIVNMYLTAEEHAALSILPARVITKRRYVVPFAGNAFSLNIFEGELAGLILCEEEAGSLEAILALSFPAWVGQDVTADPFFTGGALSAISAADLAARLI